MIILCKLQSSITESFPADKGQLHTRYFKKEICKKVAKKSSTKKYFKKKFVKNSSTTHNFAGDKLYPHCDIAFKPFHTTCIFLFQLKSLNYSERKRKLWCQNLNTIEKRNIKKLACSYFAFIKNLLRMNDYSIMVL